MGNTLLTRKYELFWPGNHRSQKTLSLNATKIVARFLTKCYTRYTIFGIDDAVIQLATALAQKYPVHGYDAVHLATAVTINTAYICSARFRLLFFSLRIMFLYVLHRRKGFRQIILACTEFSTS
jgi:hypothetical protein